MANSAIEATRVMTAISMTTMNFAARFAASGEGWVIPIVLIKAFAMSRINFMVIRFGVEGIVAGIGADRVNRECW